MKMLRGLCCCFCLLFSATQFAMYKKGFKNLNKIKIFSAYHYAKYNPIALRKNAKNNADEKKMLFERLIQRRAANFSAEMLNGMIGVNFPKELDTFEVFKDYCDAVMQCINHDQNELGQLGCSEKDVKEIKKLLEDFEDFGQISKLFDCDKLDF